MKKLSVKNTISIKKFSTNEIKKEQQSAVKGGAIKSIIIEEEVCI